MKLLFSIAILFSLVIASGSFAYAETISVDVEGTSFDIEYVASGMSVTGIVANTEFVSLILTVNVTESIGTLDITLDRSFFDSTFEDRDDGFIILDDGDESDFSEIANNSQSRTLRIELPVGTKAVEIIGTEFGVSTLGSVQPQSTPEPTEPPFYPSECDDMPRDTIEEKIEKRECRVAEAQRGVDYAPPSRVQLWVDELEKRQAGLDRLLAKQLEATELVTDTTDPTLTTISIASNNADDTSLAITGDIVTLRFIASEPIGTPLVTIDGVTAFMVPGIDNTDWIATKTITSADSEGVVTFMIQYTDLANNAGIPGIVTTDGTDVTVDNTRPTPEPTTPEPPVTLEPTTITTTPQDLLDIIDEINNLQTTINELRNRLLSLMVVVQEPITYTAPEIPIINTAEPYIMTNGTSFKIGDTIRVSGLMPTLPEPIINTSGEEIPLELKFESYIAPISTGGIVYVFGNHSCYNFNFNLENDGMVNHSSSWPNCITDNNLTLNQDGTFHYDYEITALDIEQYGLYEFDILITINNNYRFDGGNNYLISNEFLIAPDPITP